MKVINKILDNVLYISLEGELDEASAEFTRSNLDACLDNSHAKQIVIDLAKLSFMDSTGIGMLIGRYKKMKTKGVPIFISNPSSHADRIFKMTGLYEIMPKVERRA
ncbi:MAG: STAS domain-containing protein [Christensenellaceae bacterium]|jgi:stage II sporulation protein AA (anti-sigma F factor antagonist)|nr:STAS domain-containing protein [Christensenellaceae bacterium]